MKFLIITYVKISTCLKFLGFMSLLAKQHHGSLLQKPYNWFEAQMRESLGNKYFWSPSSFIITSNKASMIFFSVKDEFNSYIYFFMKFWLLKPLICFPPLPWFFIVTNIPSAPVSMKAKQQCHEMEKKTPDHSHRVQMYNGIMTIII